jgi:putative metal-binding protein
LFERGGPAPRALQFLRKGSAPVVGSMRSARALDDAPIRRASAGIALVFALFPLACGGGTSTGSSTGATGSTSTGAGGVGGNGGAQGSSASSGGTTGSGGQGGSGGTGVCMAGVGQPCYEGPAGTQGVGACRAGVKTCNAEGTAFGACIDQILPSPETCSTLLDDDCNGSVNEGGLGCICAPGATTACYSGAEGTLGVGLCKGGQQTCNAEGTGFGACVGEVLPQPENCLDAVDNDCNGETNEDGAGCVCAPSTTTSCYTGPAGTSGVGLCKAGTHACDALGTGYGPCQGEITPQPETCATPGDDDCNGQANEGGSGCVCVPGATASCYSGPAGTAGVGACLAGQHTCNALGTAYGPCGGEVLPQAETCATPGDDDCNGQVNEGGAGCVCTPNATTSCYSGPAGTAGVGACKAGSQVCDGQGTSLGPCVGTVLPLMEVCGDQLDNNCDGQVNEGCNCTPGSTTPCYTGPAGTQGVGPCQGGVQTCNPSGYGYSACVGETLPQTETCNTVVDDDCNGQTNESGAGCVCVPGALSPCYTGPAGTQGVGACAAGTKICNGQGTAYGACTGQTLPQAETCTTVVDDDCNGQTNEGGAGCVCVPNASSSCYSGPGGTAGVGICKAGTQVCNGQGTAQGPCVGEVLPQAETCSTPVDDNCNGQVNEGGAGCVCTPNATTSCYSGPAGTAGVGICKAGSQVCNGQGTSLGACAGTVLPQGENCATPADEDCDGAAPPCSGTHVWSEAWGGPVDDEGNALAVDAADNILYGGYANGPVDFGCGPLPTPVGVDSAMVMKLTPAGTCTWSKAYGNNSQVVGVAADPAGNVLATGIFGIDIDLGNGTISSAGGNDGFVVKLDGNGSPLWSRTFGDAAAQTADSVATDPSGNVIIYGYFNGTIDLGGGPLPSAGGSDLYVAKYSPTGVHLWSKRFGDSTNQLSKGLAVDASGNIIITGTINGTVTFGGASLTSAGNGDAFVAKLGPTGTHLWSKRFGDSAAQLGYGVATDPAGNVLLSGYFLGTMNFGGSNLTTLGGADTYLVKLDPSGNHAWSIRGGGASNQSAVAVAADRFGNVSIVGVLTGSGSFGGPVLTSAGSNDILVAKYDSSGNYLWSKSFGDPASQGVKGLTVDSVGNVMFTGLLFGPTDFGGGPIIGAGGEDTFLVKLAP